MNKVKFLSKIALAASIPLSLSFISCTTDIPALPPSCSVASKSTVVAQVEGVELDVVLRDFSLDYSGFEEFDYDKRTDGLCAGSNLDYPNSYTIKSNAICFSGNMYLPCSEGGTQLKYGENASGTRGFTNGPEAMSGSAAWANAVYVTKGMVQNELYYDKNCKDIVGEKGEPDYIRYRYCARPKKGNGNCYGDGVEKWFTDGTYTKTILDILTLKQTQDAPYQVHYGYNTKTNWNGYETGGFSRLINIQIIRLSASRV